VVEIGSVHLILASILNLSSIAKMVAMVLDSRTASPFVPVPIANPLFVKDPISIAPILDSIPIDSAVKDLKGCLYRYH
jgi:hypothetical protein